MYDCGLSFEPPTPEELAAAAAASLLPGELDALKAHLAALHPEKWRRVETDLVALHSSLTDAFDAELNELEPRLPVDDEPRVERITKRLLRSYLRRLSRETHAICELHMGPTYARFYTALMEPRHERVLEMER